MMIWKRLLLALLVVNFWFTPVDLSAQTRPLKKIQVGVPAISMGNIIIFLHQRSENL